MGSTCTLFFSLEKLNLANKSRARFFSWKIQASQKVTCALDKVEEIELRSKQTSGPSFFPFSLS